MAWSRSQTGVDRADLGRAIMITKKDVLKAITILATMATFLYRDILHVHSA